MSEEERKILEVIQEKVIKIEVVLLGADGDEGLVGEVQELKKKQTKQAIILYVLIGVLVGSGVLVTGALGLL